jgi:glycosyltransferase involved in cell wall biosynthesis
LKKKVVFSAVNLVEVGPLSILKDAVNAFCADHISEYRLILLINNKNLFPQFEHSAAVELQQYSYPKKLWLLRVWFEYVHCYFISKRIKPDLWFSMHDMTPNIITKNKVVYCHNPAPFYKLSLREAKIEKTLIFFNLFYSVFYRFNIRKNKFVIVQQQWMREEFVKKYKVKNVIVAHPDIQIPAIKNLPEQKNETFKFFYPAFPRVFKNFEVLLDAASLLENVHKNFEIILTIDGNENKYASDLIKKYGHLSNVKFIGLQQREQMWQLYSETNCLVFPSKLETWGLPLTEMQSYRKPILVADCRYAAETIGDYKKVCFFDPSSASKLAELMKQAIDDSLIFSTRNFILPQPPFTKNWKELFSLLLN